MNQSLRLQNMVVRPPNILDSDASIWFVHLAHASTTKAPFLSRHVRATPTSNTRGGDFGTHFLLGARGLALFGTQTFLFAKFKEFILS